jgi:hypothetical protein
MRCSRYEADPPANWIPRCCLVGFDRSGSCAREVPCVRANMRRRPDRARDRSILIANRDLDSSRIPRSPYRLKIITQRRNLANGNVRKKLGVTCPMERMNFCVTTLVVGIERGYLPQPCNHARQHAQDGLDVLLLGESSAGQFQGPVRLLVRKAQGKQGV